MRWLLVSLLLLCGCDDEAYYADGTSWSPIVALDPGRVLPSDMNGRQFAAWARAQEVIPPREGKTFTPTWAGFSADPAPDLVYYNLGATALIHIPNGVSGTSNSTSFALSGVPDEIVPAQTVIASRAVIWAIDNGNAVLAAADVQDNQIFFYIASVSGTQVRWNSTGWTNSGSKGLASGAMIMYPLVR